MKITRKQVVQKIIHYLQHRLTLDELVEWAESAMQESKFEDNDFEVIREVVSHLGLADVKAFGITWEDCENFLEKLGYQVKVTVSPTLSLKNKRAYA